MIFFIILSYFVIICLLLYFYNLFFKDFIYLFLERGKEGEKHQSVASHMYPNLGQGPQHRHVPWPGIELAIICFAGQHSTNCSTPVIAGICNFDGGHNLASLAFDIINDVYVCLSYISVWNRFLMTIIYFNIYSTYFYIQ